MKNRINMRKLIFILIGMFLCVLSIEVKAAEYTYDYETSFKFYKYDFDAYSNRTSRWLSAYQKGDVEEITDLTTIKAGDYIVVANTLKTIGNPSAVSFTFFYSYDTNIFEITSNFTPKSQVDKRWMYEGGVFPDNETWQNNGSNIDDKGVGSMSFGDSDPTAYEEFSDTSGSSVVFGFLKAKADITSDNIPSFVFYTVDNPYDGSYVNDAGETITGKFATLGSTSDSKNVYVKTVDFVPEKKASTVKTLKDLVISNGSNKYTDLSWTSGSTETSFNSVVPASISSVDLKITPFHSAASIMCSKNCTGSAAAGATMTTSLTGLTTGTNSIEVIVTAEDGSTQVYPIDIKKLNNDASLDSVTLTNGITLSYDSANKTYSATNVPYATNKTNISASVTTDSNAVIDSTGTTWSVTDGAISNVEWNLTNTGSTVNTGTIKVNAENCDSAYNNVPNNTCTTETYTINVTRNAPKTIATLKSLTVGGTLVTGFVPDDATKLEYTLNDTTSSTLNIAGVVTDNSNATITSGTGTVNLNIGDNTFNIVVTAEDGTTTNTYILKVKRLSTDATLKNLSITSSPQGTMDPATFNSATKTYKYIYDETVGNVTINATANNSDAMVKIGSDTATKGSATNSSIDPKTTTSVSVVVTAEDGTTTDTYTITFERKKSSVNTLGSLSVKDSDNNEYITSFNSNTKTYNITVPHDVTSLNVSATATSDVAKINNGTNTYTGTMDNLNFTSNSLVLTVSPEQGSDATYTINVTRTKSDNANLTDLKVDGTTVNGFNKLDDSTPFDIGSVANSVTSLNITYTQENQYSIVTIEGNTLSVGDNIVKVKVTSQDGTKTREYKIKVHRNSTDVGLSSLNVTSTPQGTLTEPDSNNQYTYTYDRTVTSVNISATANSGNPVLGTGIHNIASGDATLTVTPEDTTASVGVYTIKFVQELETDSTLSNLVISKKDGTTLSLDKTFSPTEKNYSLTVDSDVDKIDLAATLGGSYAKNIKIDSVDTANPTGTITKEISLKPGTNSVDVVVTAEDNSTTTYTINITRTINTNASLTDLKVDGVQVPDFSASKTTYNLDAVDYTKDSILIEYTEVAGATVTGDTGTQSLNPGDNKFEIKVTSQDGNNNITYVINIRRKLNDAKITNLTSSVGTLNNGSTEFQYTLDIPSGTNTVSLTPTFMTGATLKTPTSLNNIDVTNITEIRFTVQAEDNNYTNEYVVTLNKLASTNASLASLTVDQGTLDPTFNKGTTSYTVNVDSSVDTINVTAVVEDTGKATLTGDGSHSLKYGDNTITVTVTAEDGYTKDYVITVTRSKSNDTSLSDLTIDGTQIAGFTSTKDTYNISLPFGTTSFVLDATPTDSNASIIDSSNKLGTMNLTGDSGTFIFEVEAQDGTKKTYTINVTVAGNNDTSIDSLTVLGKTPTWNSANNRYELTVDGETLKVSPSDVVATFGNGASITNKDAEKNLALGGNSYKFTVTAADGSTTREVEVYITRDASTINTLDTLTSDVGTFTPVFDPDENNYKLTLPEGTTEFTISANPTSKNPATTVTGTGKYTIPVNGDKVEVIVTAEDGSVNTYEVTIEVEDSVCDLNCDLDGDGKCDLNCDTDGDGKCDINCDTDGDGKCDINCDTDGDGKCDLNCDSDGDGVCDYNCDTDGDGVCDDKCLLDKITSKIHTIDDNYVLTVREKTIFDSTFKGQFDNDPAELLLYLSDDSTQIGTQNMGTNMILKLIRNNQVLDQKILVVLGDVDGDGEVDITDASKIVAHFFGNITLADGSAISGDIDGDGSIDVTDASMIVNHFLSNINIFDN